ncbi:MAG: hypothetical protein V4628_08370 [Pseudomonadota bacterium]
MLEPDELRALCDRIIKSGELGRSRTYAAILEYLAECALTNTAPKEAAIAVDVLGREADFDVGKDSIVRVHIYHLRSKLATYFARQGATEKYRLDIPKGQYMLVTSLNAPEALPDLPALPQLSVTGKELKRRSYTPWLAGAALIVLLLNIWLLPAEQAAMSPSNPYAETALWQALLDDELPVMVVIGDYYIMGELDNTGNVSRMVREFDINSSRDLQVIQESGKKSDYMNLDLSYTPTSTSNALAQIMRVFSGDLDRVKIKMMSELNTTDMVGNHIIYLGYLSGLQGLNELMFAGSGLAIGMTYDELQNLDTDESYMSSSGLSVGENSYRDYGMVSTFPAPGGNQFVLIAGMRDEGLINLAEEVTDVAKLDVLNQALQENASDNKQAAFEALYEVLGFDNTNFDASLVYSQKLDTKVVWETRLMENH